MQETIPEDFHTTLEDYAQQGYRIIAIAYKSLDKKITYAKVQRISREKIECDLEFQGLVVLENRLKDDTTAIIDGLMTANIRTIMVTGDNMLTALSVARDCEMIPKGQSVITVNTRPHPVVEGQHVLYYNLNGTTGRQNISNNAAAQTPNGIGGDYALMTNSNSVASLETIDTCTQNTFVSGSGGGGGVAARDIEAGYYEKPFVVDDDDENPLKLAPELPCNNYRFAMTGKTWGIIRDDFPELLPKFVTRGTVFARMSPDQKQALVLELQDLGYYVAMCGDGANDCGALKAAHTGISLSEAESSVASPFTSKNPTISCVPKVIKEGRAALVTSVGIFKYMAAYSLVQFASVLILYSIDSNLTDIQFLYIDLCIISVFAFFFGKTESYDGPLVKKTPLSSLVSLSPIASLAFHLIFAIGFQALGYVHLKEQEWYTEFVFDENADGKGVGCHENYAVFVISCFQYIILAFVFSKGAPYRKTILTNYGFLIAIVINVALTIYLTLGPADWLANFFELVVPPTFSFRVYMAAYGLANLLISLFIEVVIIEHFFFKRLRYRFHNIEKSRRKYLSVENQLRQLPAWPPISLYQNFAQTPTGGEKDVSTANTFADIYVEAGVDSGPAPFDQNNSVLNSFFDQTDGVVHGGVQPHPEKTSPQMVRHRTTASTSPSSSSPPRQDNRNDSGIGMMTAASTASVEGPILVAAKLNSPSPTKKVSTLVINLGGGGGGGGDDDAKQTANNSTPMTNGYHHPVAATTTAIDVEGVANNKTASLELSNMSYNNNS